jgi:hypothetical protein
MMKSRIASNCALISRLYSARSISAKLGSGKGAEVAAEFEGVMDGGHERGLVDAEPLAEGADVRQRRLAHADDADLGEFDQRRARCPAAQPRDRRRRHPASGPVLKGDRSHALSLLRRACPTRFIKSIFV